MKLMRCGPVGQERPMVLTADGRHLDATSVTTDYDAAFWESGGIAALEHAVAEGSLPRNDITGLRIGPPIARPGAVVCIGMNYAAHAAETGAEPPAAPVVFFKAPNAVVGPYDEVLLPRRSSQVDWEVELGVVIGRRVRYLESPEESLAHVAGYVISNDVSEREFQFSSGNQWSKGKSCETFNPLGPWLATADEIPDPQTLRLHSRVNGDARQNSTTADMIFSVATLIYALSQVMVLDPGDLINTGTPEGVALSGRYPYLRENDIMEMEIDGLGAQRQALRSA